MVWKAIDRRDDQPAGPDVVLSPQTRQQIAALFEAYPTRRAALLPALHLAQQQIGYLPETVLAEIAKLFELPPADVLDTVSFYEMFWRRPKGKKLIQVCESFCCELAGQVELTAALVERLGIGPGQTTADGQFTLITVQCLAACDRAPAVQVNDNLYGPVTVEQIEEILSADAPPISHDTLIRAIELRRRLAEGRISGRPSLQPEDGSRQDG